MSYRKRTLLLLLVDAVLINIAVFLSFYIRFELEQGMPPAYVALYQKTAIVSTIIYLIVYYIFGLYRRLWQYASIGELLAIIYASTLGAAGTIAAVYLLNVFLMASSLAANLTAPIRLPHSVSVLLWLLSIFAIGGSRFMWRILQENIFTPHVPGSQKKVLIVGAGDAGVLAVRELRKLEYRSGRPVGFIDDNLGKQRLHIMGIPVLGTRKDIPRIVQGYGIDEVIIAMPSASGEAVREIVQICKKTGVSLKTLPGVRDLLSGNIEVKKIRDVQVEDLLKREPVSLNIEEIAGYLEGATVLITGAGGSIGSELCRQVCNFKPQTLILLGHGENSIFEIEQELLETYPGIEYRTEIVDIKDREKIEIVFQRHTPDVVFHAAAHKHVPLMERNPEEALKNNVVGTYNLAEAADKVGVKTFVLISTDKAVNPTSFMGASKRTAEMVIQSMDKRSQTRFVAVRFGNVLGSRGSVIPTFKRQIANGGPVTVTHPEMIRYFMTIPEAAQLVIQAGAMAKGGEIFILDMGEPVKIVDLAEDLIRLSGFEPHKDIKIEFTGIRPGEKLYEELLTAEEGTTSTTHSRIFVAKPNGINSQLIEEIVFEINQKGSKLTKEEAIELLQKVIPEFRKQPSKAVANQ